MRRKNGIGPKNRQRSSSQARLVYGAWQDRWKKLEMNRRERKKDRGSNG